MSKNYITEIKKALAGDGVRGDGCGAGPEAPRTSLLLAAANASTVVWLPEVPGAIAAEREKREGFLARFLADVDLKIAEAVRCGLGLLQPQRLTVRVSGWN
jgi:hypothetical protein